MHKSIFLTVFLLGFKILALSPLPTEPYLHVKVQDQIAGYRAIYGEILKNNPQNPDKVHSALLFGKLKNAFILARNYISEVAVNDKEGAKQDIYQKYLQILYNAADQLNLASQMTISNFERVNLLCALLATKYRANIDYDIFYSDKGDELFDGIRPKIIRGEQIAGKPGLKHFLDKGVDETINFITAGMENTYIHNKPFKPETNQFFPMAPLYMNKDIGIGYKSFNDQLFAEFPMMLATYFLSPVPITIEDVKSHKPTKKKPHYSSVDSPFSMLLHDYGHREGMYFIMENTAKIGINFLDSFRRLYRLSSTLNTQEQSILHAGLFSLTHESKMKHFDSSWQQQVVQSPQNFLDLLISATVIFHRNTLNQKESEMYKQLFRDDEYMLYWAKNSLNKPFVPLLPKEVKSKNTSINKLLPCAKDERGKPVIFLKAYNNFVTGIYDNGKLPIALPYLVDNNGMKLPEGWSWLSSEQVRADRKLTNLRQKYAKSYLRDGYSAFWKAFRELAGI